MTHRLFSSVAVCIALAAGLHPMLSAAPAPDRPADIEILVNDAPQPRYAHDGRWYVEALKGREYAIRLRNPYGVRVAVALSVDGLNTIDARETTAAGARKWVLAPYDVVTIRGWQTSETEARRFEFTTEPGSYAQSLGKTTNLGIISAAFFRERVPVRSDRSTDILSPMAPAASAPQRAAGGAGEAKTENDYAATGMGRRTGHAVEMVSLNLEDAAAQTVNIRYEYRAQLVRLGILPTGAAVDPLQRREAARGFTPGFCPEPPHHR